MKNFSKIHNFVIKEGENLLSTTTGKKFIKEYINVVKKTPILKQQLNLIDIIREGIDISEEMKDNFVNEAISVIGTYDKKDLNEAIDKLGYVINTNLSVDELTNLFENYLPQEDLIGEAIATLTENKKDVQNLPNIVKAKKVLSEAIKIKEKSLNEENHIEKLFYSADPNIVINALIENFNKEHSSSLNEDEKQLFKKIIESNDDIERGKLISEIKSECLDSVNSLIKENTNSQVKEKLLSLKELLLTEEDNLSFYEKIIKLLERKEVLSELKDE